MFSINNQCLVPEKCQNCQNNHVQHIGTARYCTQCHKILPQIQSQVKMVPAMYQSNAVGPLPSMENKLKFYINNLTAQFGGIHSNSQFHQIMAKSIQLANLRGKGTRGYRENVAVVAYFHFNVKLSVKQFCKANQLRLKTFNNRYFLYKRHIKGQQLSKKQHMKMELKQQQEKCEFYSQEEEIKKVPLTNIEGVIESLYPKIFTKPIYQSQSKDISKTLVKKIEDFQRSLEQRVEPVLRKWLLQSELRVFYLLFAVLKSLEIRISTKAYRQIASETSGFSLKESSLKKISAASFCQDYVQSYYSSQNATQSQAVKFQQAQ